MELAKIQMLVNTPYCEIVQSHSFVALFGHDGAQALRRAVWQDHKEDLFIDKIPLLGRPFIHVFNTG